MEAFKNLFNLSAAQNIARALHQVDRSFSKNKFIHGFDDEILTLELKGRMLALARRISEQLDPSPRSFPTLVASLKVLPKNPKGLSGFQVWPLTQFVAEHGLDDFEASMKALKEMTKVFTAEFAVRPFFLKDSKRMLKIFSQWARDENEHVRRLVSEGSRPLLPWGLKIPEFLDDPTLTWPLLELLKDDSSRYVQKSVANHMNDLSKKNPDWLVRKLKIWPNPWVVKHGLRTLIKKGHPGALKLLGVESKLPIIRSASLLTPKIQLGDFLEYKIKVFNNTARSMKIIADLELFLLKKNGEHNSKVFKGKFLELAKSTTQEIILRVPLKKVTTRRYHAGVHHVALLINGARVHKKKFTLHL